MLGKPWLGWPRQMLVGLVVVAIALLAGCVDLETEVRFGEANHGEVVQTLRLDESWQVWGGATAREWLDRWADRARSLGGTVRNQSDRTLTITIPFHNGRDLQSTFQAFSTPTATQPPRDAERADPSLLFDRLAFPSQFQLHQQNWLVAVRNQLRYEVDLRSLAAVGGEQFALVDADRLLRWRFGLRVPVLGDPWRDRFSPSSHQPQGDRLPQRQQGRWVWPLEPGQQTVIEAVFWVPSWVGIGSIGIGLSCAIGWWRWRAPQAATRSPLDSPSTVLPPTPAAQPQPDPAPDAIPDAILDAINDSENCRP